MSKNTEGLSPELKKMLRLMEMVHKGSAPLKVIEADPTYLIPRPNSPGAFARAHFPTKAAAAFRMPIHEASGAVLKAASLRHWAGVEAALECFWKGWDEYEVFGRPIDPEVRAALAKSVSLFDD